MPLIKNYILLLSIILTSCGNCEWTAEERLKFNKECPKQTVINNLIVEFRGFENNDFDSVLVYEYNDTILAHSFKVKVDTFSSQWEKERKSRNCSINRKLFTNCTYKFIVDSTNIFVLKKMQMIIWAMGPFCPECTMGNYTIDTVNFEHVANPSFFKKSSKNL
jgi:hypothetical protein